MDIRPKPLICEILPGFTLFTLPLWAYFRAHLDQLDWLVRGDTNVTPIIATLSVAGFLVSWGKWTAGEPDAGEWCAACATRRRLESGKLRS